MIKGIKRGNVILQAQERECNRKTKQKRWNQNRKLGGFSRTDESFPEKFLKARTNNMKEWNHGGGGEKTWKIPKKKDGKEYQEIMIVSPWRGENITVRNKQKRKP